MLTIKECREILEDESNKLTDEEVKEIRDWLYLLAEIAIENIEKEENQKE